MTTNPWTSATPASSDDLYDQFHTNVAGATPSHQAATDIVSLSTQYVQAENTVRTALNGLHATWTGRAGQAAGEPFSALIDAMRGGQEFTSKAGELLNTQATQFAEAQKKIVNLSPPPAASANPVDPLDSTYVQAQKNYASQVATNWQTFTTYWRTSQDNARAIIEQTGSLHTTAAGESLPSTAIHSGHDAGSVNSAAGHTEAGRLAASGAGSGTAASSAPGGGGSGGGPTAAAPGGSAAVLPPTVTSGGDAGVPVGSTSAQGYAPPLAPPDSGVSPGGDGSPGSGYLGGGATAGGGDNPRSATGVGFGPGAGGLGSTGGGPSAGGRAGAWSPGTDTEGRGSGGAARGGRGPAGGGGEEGAFAPGGAGRETDTQRRKKRSTESKDNTNDLVGTLDDTVPPVIE